LTIYERKVRAMASEDSDVLVRAALLRVADPRAGGGQSQPKSLRHLAAKTEDSGRFQPIPINSNHFLKNI
jgi:hypothetical protein